VTVSNYGGIGVMKYIWFCLAVVVLLLGCKQSPKVTSGNLTLKAPVATVVTPSIIKVGMGFDEAGKMIIKFGAKDPTERHYRKNGKDMFDSYVDVDSWFNGKAEYTRWFILPDKTGLILKGVSEHRGDIAVVTDIQLGEKGKGFVPKLKLTHPTKVKSVDLSTYLK
jgi:hypothetical protein